MFGRAINLKFSKDEDKLKTKVGGLLTLAMFALVALHAYSILYIGMWEKDRITFTFHPSTSFGEKINLNDYNDTFNMRFAIDGPEIRKNGGFNWMDNPYITPTIYEA